MSAGATVPVPMHMCARSQHQQCASHQIRGPLKGSSHVQPTCMELAVCCRRAKPALLSRAPVRR